MPKPKINKPAIVAIKSSLPPEKLVPSQQEQSPKPEATSNASGGTFGIGDKILVTAPWCVEPVEAEIVGLYAAEWRKALRSREYWSYLGVFKALLFPANQTAVKNAERLTEYGFFRRTNLGQDYQCV